MPPVRISVEVHPHGPATAPPGPERREVIAASNSRSEYMELHPGAVVVHRVSPERSTLVRAARAARVSLSPPEAFALRAAEKLFELTLLWNRALTNVKVTDEETLHAWTRFERLVVLSGGPPPSSVRTAADRPLRTVDLVCCTYNRYEPLKDCVPSLLSALEEASSAGLSCTLRFIYQNEDWPQWFRQRFPTAAAHPGVSLTPSSPPGLPRARNQALNTSHADVVVFIDDDVELERGFLQAHLAAFARHPEAVGSAGRIRSRIEGVNRLQQDPAVGQVRLFGSVDANFGSTPSVADTVLVHSPRGANMAYRRVAMNALLGRTDWFDEALEGSAHREESTLGVEVFQRGGFIVFSPKASLIHFEAEEGGCENRAPPSWRHVVAHRSLEHLFLQRLYQKSSLAQLGLPWATWLRDIRLQNGLRDRALLAAGGLVGLVRGRKRARTAAGWPPGHSA